MVETTGPRWGTVLTIPSASRSRSASPVDGRLTPTLSQTSRSPSRCPGFRLPDMMALRSFCATIARTVGTSSIRSVDGSSACRSIWEVPCWRSRLALGLWPYRLRESQFWRKHRDGDTGLPLYDGHAGANSAAFFVKLDLAKRIIFRRAGIHRPKCVGHRGTIGFAGLLQRVLDDPHVAIGGNRILRHPWFLVARLKLGDQCLVTFGAPACNAG